MPVLNGFDILKLWKLKFKQKFAGRSILGCELSSDNSLCVTSLKPTEKGRF